MLDLVAAGAARGELGRGFPPPSSAGRQGGAGSTAGASAPSSPALGGAHGGTGGGGEGGSPSPGGGGVPEKGWRKAGEGNLVPVRLSSLTSSLSSSTSTSGKDRSVSSPVPVSSSSAAAAAARQEQGGEGEVVPGGGANASTSSSTVGSNADPTSRSTSTSIPTAVQAAEPAPSRPRRRTSFESLLQDDTRVQALLRDAEMLSLSSDGDTAEADEEEEEAQVLTVTRAAKSGKGNGGEGPREAVPLRGLGSSNGVHPARNDGAEERTEGGQTGSKVGGDSLLKVPVPVSNAHGASEQSAGSNRSSFDPTGFAMGILSDSSLNSTPSIALGDGGVVGGEAAGKSGEGLRETGEPVRESLPLQNGTAVHHVEPIGEDDKFKSALKGSSPVPSVETPRMQSLALTDAKVHGEAEPADAENVVAQTPKLVNGTSGIRRPNQPPPLGLYRSPPGAHRPLPELPRRTAVPQQFEVINGGGVPHKVGGLSPLFNGDARTVALPPTGVRTPPAEKPPAPSMSSRRRILSDMMSVNLQHPATTMAASTASLAPDTSVLNHQPHPYHYANGPNGLISSHHSSASTSSKISSASSTSSTRSSILVPRVPVPSYAGPGPTLSSSASASNGTSAALAPAPVALRPVPVRPGLTPYPSGIGSSVTSGSVVAPVRSPVVVPVSVPASVAVPAALVSAPVQVMAPAPAPAPQPLSSASASPAPPSSVPLGRPSLTMLPGSSTTSVNGPDAHPPPVRSSIATFSSGSSASSHGPNVVLVRPALAQLQGPNSTSLHGHNEGHTRSASAYVSSASSTSSHGTSASVSRPSLSLSNFSSASSTSSHGTSMSLGRGGLASISERGGASTMPRSSRPTAPLKLPPLVSEVFGVIPSGYIPSPPLSRTNSMSISRPPRRSSSISSMNSLHSTRSVPSASVLGSGGVGVGTGMGMGMGMMGTAMPTPLASVPSSPALGAQEGLIGVPTPMVRNNSSSFTTASTPSSTSTSISASSASSVAPSPTVDGPHKQLGAGLVPSSLSASAPSSASASALSSPAMNAPPTFVVGGSAVAREREYRRRNGSSDGLSLGGGAKPVVQPAVLRPYVSRSGSLSMPYRPQF